MKPELEKLIDVVIRDGVVTEKERNVVLRKAAEMGEDPDEIEIYLDLKLEQAQTQTSLAPEQSPNMAAPQATTAPVLCTGCGAPTTNHYVCQFCGVPTGLAAHTEAEELVMLSEYAHTARTLAAATKGDAQATAEYKVDHLLADFWANAPLPRTTRPLIQVARDALAAISGRTNSAFMVRKFEVTMLARARTVIRILETHQDVSPSDLEALREICDAKSKAISSAKTKLPLIIGGGVLGFFAFIGLIFAVGDCNRAAGKREVEEWKALPKEEQCRGGDDRVRDARLAVCVELCDQGKNWACKIAEELD